MVLTENQFWIQIFIKDGICFVVSLILVLVVVWKFSKHSKKKNAKKILYQIQIVTIIFMLSYLIQNLIFIIQDITSKYSFAGNNVSKIILITSFNTLIIFRLYYAYYETIYKLHILTFIFLIILTIIDTVIYAFFQFCGIKWNLCAIYLWLHIIIDTNIGIIVIWLFVWL